jgi:cell division GTPase FtsZ
MLHQQIRGTRYQVAPRTTAVGKKPAAVVKKGKAMGEQDVIPTIKELELQRDDEPPSEEDTVKGALRLVVVGTGQCGNNIADAFHAEGVRGVGAVNSNPQDMTGLKLKHKLCLGDVDGGAGKDMALGREIVKARRDEVTEFIQLACGKRYHRLLLANSTAGGTGAGSFEILLECAELASKHLRKDKPVVGAIMALPASGGGYQARYNTLKTLEFALRAVDDHRLSPLILVDNSRMQHLANPLNFYKTVNSYIAKQLVRFNFVARTGSEVAQFDGGDLLSILDSGVVTLGMTRVTDVDKDKSIGKAVKDNFKKNLLLETSLDGANHAGCVFVGSTETFEGITQDKLEDGLDSLNKMIAAKSVMHHGVYVDDNEKGLLVTTMLGGLGAPVAYLNALKQEIAE